MSVSRKIVLFAAVAIAVTCVLSGTTLMGARMGRRIRERVVASQEQLDILNRLDDGVWPYLNALSRARQEEVNTSRVLHEHQAQVLVEQARLEATLEQEEVQGSEARDAERKDVEHAMAALLRWMESTERRLSSEPENAPLAPAVEWELYRDYEEAVGQYIDSLQWAEHEELTELRRGWDANARRSQVLATVTMTVCIAIMVMLALAIVLPLRNSLRRLRAAAERIGRGDFEVNLPRMGNDELGLLAGAMDRMATELRGTLQEKQRLIKAEAEASEREARRYSAMLEETVRTRTSELEAANARLEESLRQLRQTQEQLLFADRLATVGRLAAGVGHEINNPLSYILSNLRFIQKELQPRGAAPSPEQEELLEAIGAARDGAERVRLIVQGLRILSRPDDVALGPVDLEGVVHGAVRLAGQELRGRARLVQDCQGVPPVLGNGPRLGQVVLNLLINAAHAIPLGNEEQNEIRVMGRAAGAGSIILEVSDTGSGIPQENLERIFEPFFTTKPVGQGTGLGLSVCHSIITSMKGTIQVESQMGRGTTFRITLPQADASPAGEPGAKMSA